MKKEFTLGSKRETAKEIDVNISTKQIVIFLIFVSVITIMAGVLIFV